MNKEGRRCLLLPGDLCDASFCRAAVESTVGELDNLNSCTRSRDAVASPCRSTHRLGFRTISIAVEGISVVVGEMPPEKSPQATESSSSAVMCPASRASTSRVRTSSPGSRAFSRRMRAHGPNSCVLRLRTEGASGSPAAARSR